MPLTLNDFDYTLPPDLIAQAPLAQRSASRLLVVHPPMEGAEVLVDRNFADLPALIGPQDLLVFNDTRVIHARVHGSKASGGQIEVLIERAIGPHEALAQVRASKSPRSAPRCSRVSRGVRHWVSVCASCCCTRKWIWKPKPC